MKTKKFFVGIVTTLLCAIAMFGVLAPIAEKSEVNMLSPEGRAVQRKLFERMGAYDASLWGKQK